MATKKNKQTTSKKGVGLGVGITAAVAAAAGAYFLYGSKNAAKNRKTVKSWMLKAKAEVLEKLEQAQDMTREEYDQLIDTVSGAYKDLKTASKVDVSAFKKEMKEHWQQIAKTALPKKSPVKKVAVNTAKKPVAKTVTKTAKKSK